MFIIGYSTPEKANTFVSNRTHKNLCKKRAATKDGASIWHNGLKGIRYIGYFNNGKIVYA